MTIFVTDYAATDAVSKINALGIGWTVTGTDPSTGMTAPQALVAMIDLPPELYGQDFSMTVTLRDATGDPVMLPGPAGTPQAMRIAQVARAEEPVFPPEMFVPRHLVWAHVQMILNLANGLPLPPGLYTWSMEIDGNEDSRWATSFYVPGKRPDPVFGGPANPAQIPGVDPEA